MSRSISILLLCITGLWVDGTAQQAESHFLRNSLENPRTAESYLRSPSYFSSADTTINGVTYPDPQSVLYKSLMIPGWGQVVNKQAWKVPIVYGLLAGLTGYSIYLTKKYHDYRAAYYNSFAQSNPDDDFPDDMKFGPTPTYLAGANRTSLQDNRDFFHNRRDFIYVTIFLAYGLNAIDAYIFAHLRTFDVSEDLSMRTTMKPQVLAQSSPGFTLTFELFNSK